MATMPRAFRNIKRVIESEAARFERNRLEKLVGDGAYRVGYEVYNQNGDYLVTLDSDEYGEPVIPEAPSVSEMTRETVEADFFGRQP